MAAGSAVAVGFLLPLAILSGYAAYQFIAGKDGVRKKRRIFAAWGGAIAMFGAIYGTEKAAIDLFLSRELFSIPEVTGMFVGFLIGPIIVCTVGAGLGLLIGSLYEAITKTRGG